MNAAEIQLALQKLNVLGRALYIAAHPDDENTNLIAYWANGALLDAAYLSVTRGDGGQNLVGPELREPLGIIRTQELLAARRIDHGQQFFTRAVDFGYSKSPEETLRFWDREKILADIVWVIRKFRPDVIVTRFNPENGPTHGHHTASAQLALEAFHAAGDPARFPEQLAYVQPWQARRILWNTSRFFFQERKEPLDFTRLPGVEVGGYSPLLGKSFAEIAAASRSMHKSQGFGVAVNRNARKEIFTLLAGEPLQAGNDAGLFAGIDTTWSRVPGGAEMTEKIRRVIAAFALADPAASVPALLELRRTLRGLKDDFWVAKKTVELDELVAACLGLHLEAATEQSTARPGETLPLQFEAVNRSSVPVILRELHLPISGDVEKLDAPLATDSVFTKKLSPLLPENLPYSRPYWLREPGSVGTFRVDDPKLIGQPENPPEFPLEAVLEVGGELLRYRVDAGYRRVDPVQGEVRQPLVIAPPVFVELPGPVFVFGDAASKTIVVRVIASAETVHGQLSLEVPPGWQVEPAAVAVDLKGRDAETAASFTVKPPDADAAAGEGTLRAVVGIAGRRYSSSRQSLVYPHIPTQTSVLPAEAKLVRADIKTKGHRTVGFIPGAGDAIPESLHQLGYAVKVLSDSEIKTENLAQFDAVILGVRAFNVQSRIGAWLLELLAYAKAGGVVIAQYNTAGEQLKSDRLGPFPLHLSRERVTDETAEVRILAPDHPLVNTPNRITAQDFAGWVQERGLYFPDSWDPAWTPVFSSHDPGEQALDGGLLVAKTGKGFFVYTGYSWFRQLPAGVPGAYRIFANMIALGK